MNIVQFIILTDPEKEEVVFNRGVFLANYDEGNLMCDAYQLFDFYVAFCYELHKNERARITAHLNPDELPYIVKIDKISS